MPTVFHKRKSGIDPTNKNLIVNEHPDRYSNAMMRKDIYQYLESKGIEITEEMHEKIKEILGAYETSRMKEADKKLNEAMNTLVKLQKK